ncbi:MAG: nucleotidyltransferase family protein [Dongiaceae bacterium]
MHESLRRYWPPEGQILLLIAALADLETARRAWQQWDARQELADAASPELRLLAAVARRMPQLAPGVPLDPRLAGARRHIWTQTQMTLGTTRPLLAALHAERLRMMLLKGAARLSIDPSIAQERALRDIDVLIHPDDWERAVSVALREGWRDKHAADPAALRLAHAIGLRSPQPGARGEFDLHRQVLWECRNRGQDLDLWERAIAARFLDLDLLCPSVTDFSLVTLAQSMLYSPGPTAAHWALDVDPEIRAGRLDWALLLREANIRKIELFIASPLLMMKERLGTPVPQEILHDLTRQVGRHYLVEFETRATQYGPRTPEQFEARRTALAARAMRVARMRPYSAPATGITRPPIISRARLGRKEEMAIAVPVGTRPFERLRLYVTFDVHHARGHAYLTIEGPSLALKMIPIPRASKKRGGRVRRAVVVRCPACLIDLHEIDHVSIRTNDRLQIRNIVVSWNKQPVVAPLNALAVLLRPLRRWQEDLRRLSAG